MNQIDMIDIQRRAIMAEKLVEANCPYLKVGERMPNMNIDDTEEQLRFA